MLWSLLAILLIVLFVTVTILAAIRPAGVARLASHAQPAATYDEAVRRVDCLRLQEHAGYDPCCLTRLLTHGTKTRRAVVLVHGYTSCPQQFVSFGHQLWNRGDNVLIARLPHHGRTDRLTTEHGRLLASELAAYADQVVDIACGLGQRVAMVGLSCGALITAWAAQHRDLDRAIVIAPTFGFKQVPSVIMAPLMNVVLLLPDAFTWWERNLREESGRAYTYPRYSHHALAQILLLAFATRAHGRRRPPRARSVVVITNAADPLVDNAVAARVVRAWRAVGAQNIHHYEFPADLRLQHDLIDPAAPDARTDLVYPKLLELMDTG